MAFITGICFILSWETIYGELMYTKHADTWCTSGTSLISSQTSTVAECETECEAMYECGLFIYYRSMGTCRFHRSCGVYGGTSGHDAYVRPPIAALVTTEAPTTESPTTEFVTTVTKISQVKYWLVCGMRCQDFKYQCIWYSFNHASLECVTHKRKQQPNDHSQVISTSCIRIKINANIDKWICE